MTDEQALAKYFGGRIQYKSNGQLWYIGDKLVTYRSNGQIWMIGNTLVTYRSNGQIWMIGNKTII